jgi:hypothetical protein
MWVWMYSLLGILVKATDKKKQKILDAKKKKYC